MNIYTIYIFVHYVSILTIVVYSDSPVTSISILWCQGFLRFVTCLCYASLRMLSIARLGTESGQPTLKAWPWHVARASFVLRRTSSSLHFPYFSIWHLMFDVRYVVREEDKDGASFALRLTWTLSIWRESPSNWSNLARNHIRLTSGNWQNSRNSSTSWGECFRLRHVQIDPLLKVQPERSNFSNTYSCTSVTTVDVPLIGTDNHFSLW